MIQPEPESVSEISNMETSTISGYREGFGGFDMSLQELERLEMQASYINDNMNRVGQRFKLN